MNRPSRRPALGWATVSLLAPLIFLAACSHTSPYIRADLTPLPDRPEATGKLVLLVLGDFGTGEEPAWSVAREVTRRVQAALREGPQQVFVLELGDNFYEHGLPREEEACTQGKSERCIYDLRSGRPNSRVPGGRRANRLLARVFAHKFSELLGPADSSRGIEFYAVPGNHDHRGSVVAQKLYERAIEDHGGHWHYFPLRDSVLTSNRLALTPKDLALAGVTLPQSRVFGDSLLELFFLDTEVMIGFGPERLNTGATVLEAHLAELRRLLRASRARWKLVSGHHPLYSHGKNAGFHDLGGWIFPRDIPFFRYLPLFPVAILRNLLAPAFNHQQLHHKNYQRFRAGLERVLEEEAVPLYLAGHDHSLQVLQLDGRSPIQLVSGAAAKLSPVGDGKETLFAYEARGFAELILDPAQLYVEFIDIEGRIVFRYFLGS